MIRFEPFGLEAALSSSELSSGFELLSRCLQPEPLAAEELRSFLDRRLKEGLHHDYKAGALFGDRENARQEVRKYVSAFASSDGGVLLIGVKRDHDRDGCPGPKVGGVDLDDWVSRVISSFAPDLGPLLRIHKVDLDGLLILVVAVGRAPRLVGFFSGNEYLQYLRIGEEARLAPTYLLHDLSLGRRERPHFSLELLDSIVEERRVKWVAGQGPALFGLQVRVTNDSFLNADGIRLSMICFSEDAGEARLGELLMRNLDGVTTGLPGLKLKHLPLAFGDANRAHLPNEISLPALGNTGAFLSATCSFGTLPPEHSLEVSCALYVTANNSAPQWWQLDATFRYPTGELKDRTFELKLLPVINRRPTVGVHRNQLSR